MCGASRPSEQFFSRASFSLCPSETCSFPTIPWENNHYGHFGNPALETFSCNISSAADFDFSSSCELIDVVTENVKGAELTNTYV